MKTRLIRPFAKYIYRRTQAWAAAPIESQKKVFNELIHKAKNTVFGKEHGFHLIKNHEDFKKQVPVRDYEDLRVYVDQILAGKSDVLWKGKPRYFAKTSGTTSGVKYIPITNDSMPNHIQTARTALFLYIHNNPKSRVLDGKVIFLSGSPTLHQNAGIPTGRLSGIVNHEIPFWVKSNQLPSFPTNCIKDWEEKLAAIIKETIYRDLTLISGIPPWVKMYFEELLNISGLETVCDIFPNFEVFLHGGVNYIPYKSGIEDLIGRKVNTIETYPASEGFIAFQDTLAEEGLLLNVNSGIFFEFIPAGEIFDELPSRLNLLDVELGKDYAVIINNNAGLWAYNLGDTIRFVSKDPYRIVVSGRVKHFISAFGEHVIGKEVEDAMNAIASEQNISIVEYTIAPQVNPPEGGLPYHEWFVEFENSPKNIDLFAQKVDSEVVKQNIYYKDLIAGKILKPLVIRKLKKGTFQDYMRSIGKLGGQNKVPRLSNDRKIAAALQKYLQN
jgi:hypothetical protein